jgi:hypothetical protein
VKQVLQSRIEEQETGSRIQATNRAEQSSGNRLEQTGREKAQEMRQTGRHKIDT